MYRLIYKSRCVESIDWEMIREILRVSEKNNEANAITGALLASRTHFLQVLEGEFEVINQTFFNIAKDSRHSELQLISFGPVESRLFAHWGMKGIGAFDFNTDLAQELMKKYGEEGGSVRFPSEEWKALALIHEVEMMEES